MKANKDVKDALESIAFGTEVALRPESQTNITSFSKELGANFETTRVSFEMANGATFILTLIEPNEKREIEVQNEVNDG